MQEKNKEKQIKTENYTSGNIKAAMIRLSIPMILGNILQQLYNTIDAWVVGKFAGTEEFAAIGVAGTVMNLFIFAIVGACVGISVLFSQLYGAGDMEQFRKEHFQALVIGVAGTAGLALLGFVSMPILLRVMRTPQEIERYVRGYLSIILLGLPAAYIYNLYNSLLRSVGNVKAALYILAAAAGTNLVLDLLFVGKFQWGIQGAAIATVLAQIFSALLCAGYLKSAMKEFLFHREDWGFSSSLLKKTVSFGAISALHQAGLYIGKFFVQGAINTGGTDLIAAYTATTRIEGFANSFGDSGASATSVVVAQNYGAGKEDRVKKSFWDSFLLLALLGLASSAILYTTAGSTVAFMLGSRTGLAYEQAVKYLHLVSLFYVFCFTGNTFVGSFNGEGHPVYTCIGAISHISIRVVISWIFIGAYALPAVAVGTGIGWVYVNIFWAVMLKRLDSTKISQNLTK